MATPEDPARAGRGSPQGGLVEPPQDGLSRVDSQREQRGGFAYPGLMASLAVGGRD